MSTATRIYLVRPMATIAVAQAVRLVRAPNTAQAIRHVAAAPCMLPWPARTIWCAWSPPGSRSRQAATRR